MKTGVMHSGGVVHAARFVKSVGNYDCYAPACKGMGRGNISYLSVSSGEQKPVTCQRCQCVPWVKRELEQGAAR